MNWKSIIYSERTNTGFEKMSVITILVRFYCKVMESIGKKEEVSRLFIELLNIMMVDSKYIRKTIANITFRLLSLSP